MPKKLDRFTRPDGMPNFTFWREVRNLLKDFHENVEAAKLIQEQMNEEKPRQDQAWNEFRQPMAKFDSV